MYNELFTSLEAAVTGEQQVRSPQVFVVMRVSEPEVTGSNAVLIRLSHRKKFVTVRRHQCQTSRMFMSRDFRELLNLLTIQVLLLIWI